MKPETLRQILATNIRRLLAEQSMSIPVFADVAELNSSYVYRVFAGNSAPTLTWLCKVANALKVEPSELLERPSRPRPRPQ